jgi:hypothetical protein
MFLSVYHFDGALDELLPAYGRLHEMLPPTSFELHAVVTRAGGISVYDACPDRDTADAFQSSTQFSGTVDAAGLPQPRIEQLGEIHRALVLGGQALV